MAAYLVTYVQEITTVIQAANITEAAQRAWQLSNTTKSRRVLSVVKSDPPAPPPPPAVLKERPPF